MKIRKHEAFCRVVELKSFTKAAEAVFLTQPTVSQHIQDLEQELDQKLFDRLGRQIIPTHVGRIFYDYASRILQIQTEAVQAVEDDISWGRLAAISIKGHKLQRPFYLIKRKNRNLSPVAAAFQAYLIAKAGKS